MASNNIIIDTPTKINADKQDTKDTKPPNTTTDNQPSPNPPPTDRPGWAVECNMMEFVDGSGVKHKIHLPKGTMKRACQLLVEENWDELVKFPVYSEWYLVLVCFYRMMDHWEFYRC